MAEDQPPRFRYIDSNGLEHSFGNVGELADACRSGAVLSSGLLFDSLADRWCKAEEHDVVRATMAAPAVFPPQPTSTLFTPTAPTPTVKSGIERLLDGDIPLVRMFWLYSVGVTVAFNLSAQAVRDLSALAGTIIGIAYLVYQLPALIGLWQSSEKYTGSLLWRGLAKAYMVIQGGLFVLSLYKIMMH